VVSFVHHRPARDVPRGTATGLATGRDVPRRAVSKFLIVITLILGFDELLGNSATQSDHAPSRLILCELSRPSVEGHPFVETAALHNLEGASIASTKSVDQYSSSPLAQAAAARWCPRHPPGPEERPEIWASACGRAVPRHRCPLPPV